jgi:hypothetical protein
VYIDILCAHPKFSTKTIFMVCVQKIIFDAPIGLFTRHFFCLFTQGTKNIKLLLIFLLNSSNFTLLNFKNFIHSNGGSIIAYPSLLKLTQDLMIHTQCIVESNREANERQQHMIQ